MFSTTYDCDAWKRYPQHRWVFNKLELSLRLGYNAGPGGVPVPEDGDFVVRPIYNLSGMGAGAYRARLLANDYKAVPPGFFWTEYLHGPVISVDYKWDEVDGEAVLRPYFACKGVRTASALYRFNAWQKINPPYLKLPKWIVEFTDVPEFNIEFIDDKIIEIHLRPGTSDFPKGATELIPVWDDMTDEECKRFERFGYKMQTNFDDADGHLDTKRLGFLWR